MLTVGNNKSSPEKESADAHARPQKVKASMRPGAALDAAVCDSPDTCRPWLQDVPCLRQTRWGVGGRDGPALARPDWEPQRRRETPPWGNLTKHKQAAHRAAQALLALGAKVKLPASRRGSSSEDRSWLAS